MAVQTRLFRRVADYEGYTCPVDPSTPFWGDPRCLSTAMAPLFLNKNLRIADEYETIGECLTTQRSLGFDTANVNGGYGRALDFVMDGVINALGTEPTAIASLLRRD